MTREQRRAWQARKLKESLADGSLTIRQATAEERERYGIKPRDGEQGADRP